MRIVVWWHCPGMLGARCLVLLWWMGWYQIQIEIVLPMVMRSAKRRFIIMASCSTAWIRLSSLERCFSNSPLLGCIECNENVLDSRSLIAAGFMGGWVIWWCCGVIWWTSSISPCGLLLLLLVWVGKAWDNSHVVENCLLQGSKVYWLLRGEGHSLFWLTGVSAAESIERLLLSAVDSAVRCEGVLLVLSGLSWVISFSVSSSQLSICDGKGEGMGYVSSFTTNGIPSIVG